MAARNYLSDNCFTGLMLILIQGGILISVAITGPA